MNLVMNFNQLQDIYNSNMGKYCKPGEKKGMQLAEFLQIMEKYQVYNDQFRVRDVKDPFLVCKLVVLDEMATAGHKKLYMTDFMELLMRISALRYPAKLLTVVEVAKGLQKLFINHFYKHEEILDQFRETVDQAVMQDRVEAFASAINAQKKKPTTGASDAGGGRRGSGKLTQLQKISQSLVEHEDEDVSSDEDEDVLSEEDEEPPAPSSATAELGTVVREEGETEEVPGAIKDGTQDEASLSSESVEDATAAQGGAGDSHIEPEIQEAKLPAG